MKIESHKPMGNIVICDVCNGDFTDSELSGGFIFGSNAYCPRCAKRNLPMIKSYNEEHYIKAFCPEGVTFADFVRKYRGPNAAITVMRLDNIQELEGFRESEAKP